MIRVATLLRERNGRFALEVETDRKRMYYRPSSTDHELLMEHLGERVHVTIEHGEISRVVSFRRR